MGNVSIAGTMGEIKEILDLYENQSVGGQLGRGPLQSGELLNLAQGALVSLKEVFHAWETTRTRVLRSEEDKTTHGVG